MPTMYKKNEKLWDFFLCFSLFYYLCKQNAFTGKSANCLIFPRIINKLY